ncbi:MAG: DEAD/DEAH box helicase, partial [Candidatus Omnitrophota bacterium]
MVKSKGAGTAEFYEITKTGKAGLDTQRIANEVSGKVGPVFIKTLLLFVLSLYMLILSAIPLMAAPARIPYVAPQIEKIRLAAPVTIALPVKIAPPAQSVETVSADLSESAALDIISKGETREDYEYCVKHNIGFMFVYGTGRYIAEYVPWNNIIVIDLADFEKLENSDKWLQESIRHEKIHAEQFEWLPRIPRSNPFKGIMIFLRAYLAQGEIAFKGREAVERPAFDGGEEIRLKLGLPKKDDWEKDLVPEYRRKRPLDIMRFVFTNIFTAFIILLPYFCYRGGRAIWRKLKRLFSKQGLPTMLIGIGASFAALSTAVPADAAISGTAYMAAVATPLAWISIPAFAVTAFGFVLFKRAISAMRAPAIAPRKVINAAALARIKHREEIIKDIMRDPGKSWTVNEVIEKLEEREPGVRGHSKSTVRATLKKLAAEDEIILAGKRGRADIYRKKPDAFSRELAAAVAEPKTKDLKKNTPIEEIGLGSWWSANGRALRKKAETVKVINQQSKEIRVLAMSDEELRAAVITAADDADDKNHVRLAALIREAAKRVVGEEPFDVQELASLVLMDGNIAELPTGAGKTLVAVTTIIMNALLEKGKNGNHVVVPNDYLAREAVSKYGELFGFLGVTVGVIQGEDVSYKYDVNTKALESVTRQDAYRCQAVYGTASEFGFDELRDGLVTDAKELRVSGERNFVIVDEVDHNLVDEATTPLIISARDGRKANDSIFLLADKIAAGIFKAEKDKGDYEVDKDKNTVSLTDRGELKLQKIVERLTGEYFKAGAEEETSRYDAEYSKV